MGLQGDLDGDGKLGRTDLDLLKQLVRQYEGDPERVEQLPPEMLDALDVNRDRQIDQDDVEALCRLLMRGDNAKTREMLDKFQSLRAR